MAVSNGTEEISASQDEMHRVVAEALPLKRRTPGSESNADEESGMWSMDEELVVWRAPHQAQPVHMAAFRGVAVIGAVLSVGVALFRSLEPALAMLGSKGPAQKYYV